jgi:hypothetical protein
MAGSHGEKKRFGGHWVRQGEQFKDRNRVPRLILSRFWYLLVPFIGIMCAHQAYVRPDLEDIKNTTNLERKELLDEQDNLKAQITALQSQEQEVSAEIDTLYTPQINYYQAIYDSLLTLRRVYDETLPRTKRQIDSLRTIADGIEDDLDRLSEVYRRRSATLDSLAAWQATLEDSTVLLDERIALKTDRLFRTRYPEEHRRKEAVFTGEGVYPRRDENPVRQTGGK